MVDRNLIIYTLGMKRMYLAETARVPRNIEVSLNTRSPDSEIILENVQGFHNFDGAGYRPNTLISEIGIKGGHIDLITGTEDLDSLIYNANAIPRNPSPISIRFGIVPFSHGLVAELEFPESYIPKEEGRLGYVTEQLDGKKFVRAHNPRQPENPYRTDRSKNEFSNLFKGTPFEDKTPPKILLNRTMHTVNSKALWVPYENRSEDGSNKIIYRSD